MFLLKVKYVILVLSAMDEILNSSYGGNALIPIMSVTTEIPEF